MPLAARDMLGDLIIQNAKFKMQKPGMGELGKLKGKSQKVETGMGELGLGELIQNGKFKMQKAWNGRA